MSDAESLKLLMQAIAQHERENPEHDPVDTRLYEVLESATARFRLSIDPNSTPARGNSLTLSDSKDAVGSL
ncbi:MAG TPA: hypothetical protein VGH74_06855 [Planctomycetaceae bacterium]|jgi:hypothetical protein